MLGVSEEARDSEDETRERDKRSLKVPPAVIEFKLLKDLWRLSEEGLPALRRSKLLCEVRRRLAGEEDGDPTFDIPPVLVILPKFQTDRLWRRPPGGRLENEISMVAYNSYKRESMRTKNN